MRRDLIWFVYSVFYESQLGIYLDICVFRGLHSLTTVTYSTVSKTCTVIFWDVVQKCLESMVLQNLNWSKSLCIVTIQHNIGMYILSSKDKSTLDIEENESILEIKCHSAKFSFKLDMILVVKKRSSNSFKSITLGPYVLLYSNSWNT